MRRSLPLHLISAALRAPERGRRAGRFPGWAVVVVLTAGCGGGTRTDASAWVACRDFAALVDDVKGGVVAGDELRPRMQRIDANAQLADDPAVRENARAMLRVATTGTDPAAFDSATARMARACLSHAR